MRTRKSKSNGFEPDDAIVPAELDGDDALWMLLNAYADGEASAEETAYVESIIRTNPAIAREFRFLELTADSVRQFGEIDPPDSLADSIFAATARRKTLFQRVCAVWTKTGAIFEPAPLRIAATALASGILVMVMWSKFGPQRHALRPETSGSVAINIRPNELPHTAPHDVMPPARRDRVSPAPTSAFVPEGPQMASMPQIPTADTQGMIKIQAAADKTVVRSKPQEFAVAAPNPGTRRVSAPPKATASADAQSPAPAAPHTPNMEERHMVADNDSSGGGKPVDLGPDVDPRAEVKPDEVAMVTPAAVTTIDEPPTAAVTAVSYGPGSISDKTRNAPPAVQDRKS